MSISYQIRIELSANWIDARKWWKFFFLTACALNREKLIAIIAWGENITIEDIIYACLHLDFRLSILFNKYEIIL